METGLKTITIAGGGLAGLSLGIGLRQEGIPVVLHEAGTYPRHRVCGEFISGLEPTTIASLGLDGVFADAVCHHSTAWYRGGKPLFTADLPEPALGLSRFVLDARLQERFQANGGQLRERSRQKRQEEDRPGLVWATGRLAAKSSPWLGLKAHFHGMALQAGLEMHIGRGLYVGLTSIPAGRVNVCALVRRPIQPAEFVDGRARFLGMLEAGGLESLAQRLAAADFDEKSLTGVTALTFGMRAARAEQAVEGDLCAIGDAHRLIPPFTGNGMTMAFQSAESARPALAAYARGERGWTDAVAEVRAALRRRFRMRLRMARLLHPFLTQPVGQALLSAGARLHGLPFQRLYRAVR